MHLFFHPLFGFAVPPSHVALASFFCRCERMLQAHFVSRSFPPHKALALLALVFSVFVS
eukprot:m.72177 g.72177  ORF g.72177 m.72177 type:complete len:59 (+) comp7984_c2_seq1:120-296(+)